MHYLLTQLSIHGPAGRIKELAQRYGDGGGALLRGYDWSPDVAYQEMPRYYGTNMLIDIGTHRTSITQEDPLYIAASFAAPHPDLRISAEVCWSSHMPPHRWPDSSLLFVDHAVYINGTRHYPDDDIDALYA